MALIEWDNAQFSVNVKKFDDHHKKLMSFVNELHDAMMNGKGKETVHKILMDLKEYTQYHFEAEENEMIRVSYPEYSAHKKQHKELIDQLTQLIQNYEWGKREISIDTLKFLKEWLFSHIQGSDRKYSPYMSK